MPRLQAAIFLGRFRTEHSVPPEPLFSRRTSKQSMAVKSSLSLLKP
jgi:hypothetical protein